MIFQDRGHPWHNINDYYDGINDYGHGCDEQKGAKGVAKI
jgi:hypothetical protein